MSASDRSPRLRIRRRTWRRLIDELEARGHGTRESGAFLLGNRRGRRRVVTHIAYFDDLEPGALNGAVRLTHRAYSALWARCASHGVEVLADVHTHPGDIVRQSQIDQDNPLVAQRGHVALIVPRFAAGHTAPDDVGAYEYLGDEGWRVRPGAVRHGRFL